MKVLFQGMMPDLIFVGGNIPRSGVDISERDDRPSEQLAKTVGMYSCDVWSHEGL